MNKYKKAFERIVEACSPNRSVIDDLVLIDDLVKKEIPRMPKVYKEEWGVEPYCPKCLETIEGEEPYRCSNCGQRLDWAFDDE